MGSAAAAAAGAGSTGGAEITEWTEQETSLLLKGIVEFGNDWDKIEEFVGSKTREECINQYLRLPLAEASELNEHDETKQEAADEEDENEPETLLSFLASCFEDTKHALEAVDAAKAAIMSAGEAKGTTRARSNGEVAMEAIVAAALAAASIRAEALASQEEHQVRLLVLQAASLQLQKLDIKLRQLTLYESCVEDEWALLERARISVLAQRLAHIQNQLAQKQQKPTPPTTAGTERRDEQQRQTR